MDRPMKLTSYCAAVAVVRSLPLPRFAPVRPPSGAPAPEVVATQLDGKTFDLSKLRGQVVVVNFWATWCPPCRAEMPAMDAFYRKHRGDGLAMIGLSEDKARELPQVKNIMAAFAYPAALTRMTLRSTSSACLRSCRKPSSSTARARSAPPSAPAANR